MLRRLGEGTLRGEKMPEGRARAEHSIIEEGPDGQAPPRQSPVVATLATRGGKDEEASVSSGSSTRRPESDWRMLESPPDLFQPPSNDGGRPGEVGPERPQSSAGPLRPG